MHFFHAMYIFTDIYILKKIAFRKTLFSKSNIDNSVVFIDIDGKEGNRVKEFSTRFVSYTYKVDSNEKLSFLQIVVYLLCKCTDCKRGRVGMDILGALLTNAKLDHPSPHHPFFLQKLESNLMMETFTMVEHVRFCNKTETNLTVRLYT